ncbi:MAG: ATP-binding cassette domain-containing protein, partial [Myxococcota bacterium]
MSGLTCANVSVQLGRRPVLHGVTLTVRPGEILALVGPNGAGKSTLLRTLAGELIPHAGSVNLDGTALTRWDPRSLALRRAVLPQRPRLDAPFCVADVVRLGRHPHRSRLHVDDAAVERALSQVGMLDRAADAWTRLSGGEQQRVAL